MRHRAAWRFDLCELKSRSVSRLRSLLPARPEGLAGKLSRSQALAVALSPEGLPSSGLRSAAPWRSLARPEGPACFLLRATASSGRKLGPKTRPASKCCRQPLAGRSLGPKTSFASFEAPPASHLGRQDPKTLLSAVVSRRSLPSKGSVRRPNLPRVKSCRPRPPAPPVRRPRMLTGRAGSLGCVETQPQPRLGTRWNMSTRVPSGVGRWAPLRALLEHSRTVPLLHFSLGFKDSGRLLARRAQAHRGESGVGSLPPSSF
jgi:hypothetical protein